MIQKVIKEWQYITYLQFIFGIEDDISISRQFVLGMVGSKEEIIQSVDGPCQSLAACCLSTPGRTDHYNSPSEVQGRV